MKFGMKSFAVALALLTVAIGAAQQEGRQGRRNWGGQRQQMGAMVLLRSDVQEDLKLSDEQKTKLETMRQSLRGGRRGGGRRNGGDGAGGAGGGERQPRGERPTREQMEAQREAQQKQINDLLTPDQQKRLKEIQLQLAGSQAIVNPEVQKDLALTDAQKTKIASLQKTFRDAMGAIRERVQKQEITREQSGESMRKNNDVLREELQKVLTPEQAAKLKAMGGKPFERSSDN